ncbi:MAG TPA: SAM-dependent methyltransferase [Kineosporiaceae bacterium]|nr:SAM-dependent methyltransferase [Kineosporiaceae bacterium]
MGSPDQDRLLSPTAPAEDHEHLSFDTSVSHPARRYNYWLGGKDNFAADRASGDAIAQVIPTIRLSALENRRFLSRAVSYLAREAGVRQFLDIGTGIPAANNTHEVAQSIAPESRVVYVDNDPIVLVHARALLRGQGGKIAYLDADLREPESILGDPALTATLDLTQPVGLMLIAILHFLRDETRPFDIVRQLLDALPAGSFLAVSHATHDFMAPGQAEEAGANDPSFQFRSKDEFAQFFEGVELVEPGITSIAHWRAESEPEPRPSAAEVSAYGAVGRLPQR